MDCAVDAHVILATLVLWVMIHEKSEEVIMCVVL